MSSQRRYDAIVVGAGTIGGAALYHLARRGLRVLGLDAHTPPHEHGSMHGETRIIRLAYHEHPDYVPLLRRAYELWHELDPTLVHRVGSVDVGPEDGAVVGGALRALEQHGIAYERGRSGALSVPRGHVALFQPDGGFVEAERAIRAHLEAAAAAGADLRTGEAARAWSPGSVETERGVYEAERLVLCPGTSAAELLALPPELFAVERQVVAWFDAPGLDGGPVYVCEEDDGANHYGIAAGGRLKAGLMHCGELAPVVEFVRRRVPGARELVATQTCWFTNTPDRHFVLDLHPASPAVAIASVCSGHGFKFAPVAGEALADLVTEGGTPLPIGFLGIRRLLSERDSRVAACASSWPAAKSPIPAD